MIEVLVCVLALGQPLEMEECRVDTTTQRVEVYCAWASAATLAKGRGRVSFCQPANGRTKP